MRRLLAMAAIGALLLAPASVAAAEPVTVQVLDTNLIARGVVVNVEVEYSCTRLVDPEPPDWALYEETYVDVSIEQAVGRQRASGNDVVWFEGDDQCDGLPHTLVVSLAADPGGPAFKSGPAALTVTAKASYGWYTASDDTGPYAFFDRYATIGWSRVHLSR